MQISHFGSRKDDQPKNQVLKSTPNIEKASLSKLDIDLRLPNLYRWYGQRSIQIIYFFQTHEGRDYLKCQFTMRILRLTVP